MKIVWKKCDSIKTIHFFFSYCYFGVKYDWDMFSLDLPRERERDSSHRSSVWLCELICAGTQRFLYINWFLWVLDLNVFKPPASCPSVKHPHSLSRAPSLAHFSHPLSGLPHCLASLLLPSVLCPLPLSLFPILSPTFISGLLCSVSLPRLCMIASCGSQNAVRC